MADTCSTCLDISAHKLGAYPPEYDLPSPSDHWSTMINRAVDQICSQGSMQLFPEMSD
jgi:hypothetical protein